MVEQRTKLIPVAVLIFLALPLSLVAAGSGTFDLDITVINAVQEHTPDWIRPFFAGMNWLGSGGPLTAFCCLVAIALWLKSMRLESVYLLIVAATSQMITDSLKWLMESPRPPAAYVQDGIQRDGYGFPSGHTLTTFMIVGFLISIAAAQLTGWIRWCSISLGVAFILLMGLARIVIGAHWLSDVLGGYLWGGLGLALMLAIYSRIAARRDARTASTSSSGNSHASSMTSK